MKGMPNTGRGAKGVARPEHSAGLKGKISCGYCTTKAVVFQSSCQTHMGASA